MAETIQFICHINNRTSVPLKLKSFDQEWGKCTDGPNQCPVEIAVKEQKLAFRCSGRRGSSSGTEGTAVYQLGDDPEVWIKIYWDVTWCAGCDNHLKTGASDEDIAVEANGFSGSGSVEDVTIKVIDGRGQHATTAAGDRKVRA